MINITIGADGVPSQRKIVLGNRYENNDEQVVFTLPQDFDTYNKYVIAVIKINSENITRVLPVHNNTLVVSSSLTYYSGNWSLYLMARQTEIDLDSEYIDIGAKDGEHVFISDGFIGIVNKNNIEKTEVDNIPIDTNLQIIYDDLLSLKTELEKIIDGLDSNISLKVENEVARVKPGIIDEVVATVRPMIADGKSAYEIAVEHGFKGTEEEWLASLDYETSEEFNSLAAQVKEDANTTSSNRTTVEQLATQVQENAAQASSSATSAQESATSASSSAVQANESKLAASASAAAAEESNQSAITHANQAKGYSDNAKTSSDNADAVKTTVEQLAGQARTYSNEANEAAQSALEAAESALEAAESANQSSISAGASATSAGQSATSASKAASSATEAATNAEQSAQSAADSAQSARQFATSASQSANSASESAESAQQSATSAQESAISAGESATSAGESAESALQAEGFATQAQTSATQAASSASQASQSATNAAKSETNSANSASEAAGSAAAAQQSASSAEANAQIATTKAQEAITSATNASTSESNAATSETNAQTYMNQAKTYSETASSEADRATLATDGKLDKNQGTDNVGKVMVVGEDGELTPTEYKSGSDNIIYKDVAKQLNPNITDSFQRAMWNLKLYGQSTQGADPSPAKPQEITAISEFEGAPTGKNLIDTTDYNSASSNGITATYNKQEDYYLLNGECIGSAALNFPLIINGKQTDYTISLIYLDGDFSIPDSEYCVAFVGKSDFKDNGNVMNWLNSENVNKNKISQGTSTLNAKYIRNFWFYVSNGVICNNLKVRVQLEEGSAVTEYESFKSQPFTYTPTNPMYSTQDGSISDYVDVENGVEVYQLKKVIFDGTNATFIKLNETNVYYTSLLNDAITPYELAYEYYIWCDKLKTYTPKTSIDNLDNAIKYGNGSGTSQLLFLKVDDTITTVEQLNTWLQSNPITVVYVLQTPTEIPIDPEQLAMLRALYTYTGVTNFLCNAPVSFDYEQSLQIVIQNIWNAIGQTNANILLGGNQ